MHFFLVATSLTTAIAQLNIAPAPVVLPVLWQRGEEAKVGSLSPSLDLRLGVVDRDGNFVPSRHEPLRARPAFSGHRPSLIANLNSGGFIESFEHRSGTLIAGRWGETRFVPEVGSKVVPLGPRSGPGKVDRLVYNRQQSVKDFWTLEVKAKYPTGLPKVSAPPSGGTPPGWELVAFKTAYPSEFPKSDPWFVRAIGNVAEYGYLDSAGDFAPDYGLPVLNRSDAPRDAVASGLPNRLWRYAYTLPLNNAEFERVCEFRSGRVIEGTLYNTGNFAPLEGSTIRDFKDYNPDSDPRVYNLPGLLRKTQVR